MEKLDFNLYHIKYGVYLNILFYTVAINWIEVAL